MTIYEELIEQVEAGKCFHVDFKKQSLSIGKKKLIDGGGWNADRELHSLGRFDLPTILSIAEEMYRSYKYSLPSERSESKRHTYFKALPTDELSDEQMIFGEKREVAKARLEGFILCMIVDGQLTWDEVAMGKWFYQSNTEPDFVLLRDWIEKEENKNEQKHKNEQTE